MRRHSPTLYSGSGPGYTCRMTRAEPEKNHLWVDGSISYFGIPAVDAEASSAFYASVFGWSIRSGVSFDDARGHLSGFFTTAQKPSREAGLLPYIYVDHIDDALERVAANGGEVVSPPFPEEKLWVATFRDPAGNVMGIWHRGPR